MFARFICFFAILPLAFLACSRDPGALQPGALPSAAVHAVSLQEPAASGGSVAGGSEAFAQSEISPSDFLAGILAAAELPQDLAGRILDSLAESPAFIIELSVIMQGDTLLRRLVDKERALPSYFSPHDLVALGGGGSFSVTRTDLRLRLAAASSLEEMAATARLDGVTLVAASAYRSFNNQVQVHDHWVQVLGREEAERVSARPGHSEHQLGLALDFAPINLSFAETREGMWLAANAARFGWSLSYPDGYEHITGYSWEPWHYRYVGRELAAFIHNHFGGIQQFALRFIYEWENAAATSPVLVPGAAHG